MRYFFLIVAVMVLVVIGVAGRRGDLTRNRPIQIFPDMKRQLKLRPQTPNGFFANGLSSQLPQAGTLSQSKPLVVAGQEVYETFVAADRFPPSYPAWRQPQDDLAHTSFPGWPRL